MTKKHSIALADAIKQHNTEHEGSSCVFNSEHIKTLARFCEQNNRNFMTERWRDYIEGLCGPNGGAVRP